MKGRNTKQKKPYKLLDFPWAKTLELVVWEDAALNNDWCHVSQAMLWAKTEKVIHSVGWVIEDNDSYLLLAQSLDEQEQTADILRVPKRLVAQRRKIHVD